MYKDDRYTRITLRIPKDLHEQLSSYAEQTSKSMNAEIIGRLEQSFARSEPRNKPEDEMYTAEEIKGFIEKVAQDFIAQKLAEKSKE
ncbi:MAG: Arc family DNA-binding protein [Halopseudomonas sp.]|uniref:Arc family DNA-binding protein n=1 Tax=Halopseudomonas sp. TaxID=2901191 RepID=UPI00300344F4